jgi:hypothetical protein
MKSIVSMVFATMLGVGAVACTIGGPTTLHETIGSAQQQETASQKCDSGFMKPDLSTLKPCGDHGARAHCYDPKKVAMGGLATCDDGDVCVPDKVLEADGAKLQSCTFYINGSPGICMSSVVPQIAQNAGALHQEGCDPDEKCIPCINPIDKSDTHVCDPQGVHADDCSAGDSAPKQIPCCAGNGVCMDPDAAPEGSRDQLHKDACPGQKLCAPAALVNGTPHKCSALGIDGVCLDLCFAAMLKGTGGVIRGDCGPTELCLPCAIGKSQGVPGCD